MEITGDYRIDAAREAVWRALNDPDILRQCIPGCQELEKLSDTEYTAKVATKIGPMQAKFTGKVTLSDMDPPNGYRISGEGQGGVAGFAKGGATVTLGSDGEATLLHYDADAQIGGKMAQLGSRLIDATARKTADQFFGAFSDLVGGAPQLQATPDGAPEEAPDRDGKGLAPMIWIGALIAVVIGVLVIFSSL